MGPQLLRRQLGCLDRLYRAYNPGIGWAGVEPAANSRHLLAGAVGGRQAERGRPPLTGIDQESPRLVLRGPFFDFSDASGILASSWLMMRIDWINATSKECSPRKIMKAIGGKWIDAKPVNGYLRGWRSGPLLVCEHPNNIEMGTFICCPGESDPGQYVEILKDHCFRPSRLDLCQDTDKITINQIVDAFDKGKIAYVGKLKNVRANLLMGLGLYDKVTFGDRESETYVRCYDKGLEQGEPAGTWTRLEWEFKGDMAKAVWDDLDNAELYCIKKFRILHRNYKNKSEKTCKLDKTFANIMFGTAMASVLAVSVLGDRYYGLFRRKARNISLKRSREHMLRIIRYVKTWLAADPRLAASLASALPNPELFERISHELDRHGDVPRDLVSEWARFSLEKGSQRAFTQLLAT